MCPEEALCELEAGLQSLSLVADAVPETPVVTTRYVFSCCYYSITV